MMRDATAPRIVQFHDRPLAWPSARLSHERRVARLRKELGDLIGISASGLDDDTLAEAVADWVAQDRADRVLYYPIFVDQVSRRDKALIAYLAEFWRRVKLPRPVLGVTVFICIHCRSSWLQRYWGPAASCVRHVRSRCKDVCILGHLEPLHRDEVDRGVDVKCREALELTAPRRAGGLERPRMLLYGDELKLAAKTAFGGRARRHFFPLKAGLERAIEKAHEKFLGRGGVRSNGQ